MVARLKEITDTICEIQSLRQLHSYTYLGIQNLMNQFNKKNLMVFLLDFQGVHTHTHSH